MTTNATEPKRAFISNAQVVVLNEARTVLAEIEKANYHDFATQASGMIMARAAVAADSLFGLLNWYGSYAYGELTNAQLHNNKAGA